MIFFIDAVMIQAEGHTTLATEEFMWDWDWKAAESEFRLKVQRLPQPRSQTHKGETR